MEIAQTSSQKKKVSVTISCSQKCKREKQKTHAHNKHGLNFITGTFLRQRNKTKKKKKMRMFHKLLMVNASSLPEVVEDWRERTSLVQIFLPNTSSIWRHLWVLFPDYRRNSTLKSSHRYSSLLNAVSKRNIENKSAVQEFLLICPSSTFKLLSLPLSPLTA